MEIREMTAADIPVVLPMYLSYYNQGEEVCCWTEKTAGSRMYQVLSTQDAYALLLEENGKALGFAMGYFKQYADIVGYTLEEILIIRERQNQGLGSFLLRELERRVKEKGAACIELQAVSSPLHEHYYGKSGYHNAKNFVMKVKWF